MMVDFDFVTHLIKSVNGVWVTLSNYSWGTHFMTGHQWDDCHYCVVEFSHRGFIE